MTQLRELWEKLKFNSDPSSLTEEQIQEMIRNKAYELYVKRGCKDGHHLEDWVTAQKTVYKAIS